MKYSLISVISFLILSCTQNNTQSGINVTVTENELPEASSYPIELDRSDYAAEFIANCQTCHTARYIEMQPNFSKKTWTKIVDKMIHSYGAPIDSVQAKRIVDYLVWSQDQ